MCEIISKYNGRYNIPHSICPNTIHMSSCGNLMVKHQFQQNVWERQVFIMNVSAAI